MCTSIKIIKKYFANLNEKGITDKVFFLANIPCLSEKTKSEEKNTLIENEKLVSDDSGG